MEARTDDVEKDFLPEAACPPIVPPFTGGDNTHCKKEGLRKNSVGKSLPSDLTYSSKVARYDIGCKMMAAAKKLPWDKGAVLQFGWKGNKSDVEKDVASAEWLLVSGFAARVFNEHLASFPQWTYSTLTIAKGSGLNKMLVQGGAGGSAVWCRSKTRSVLMKIGGSRKFNSNDRIVDYHSRAPASIHTLDEEAIAVLAHNLSGEPFEDPKMIRKLTALGLAPAPVLGEEEDDEITDPESDEEELLPRGLVPAIKGFGTKH